MPAQLSLVRPDLIEDDGDNREGRTPDEELIQLERRGLGPPLISPDDGEDAEGADRRPDRPTAVPAQACLEKDENEERKERTAAARAQQHDARHRREIDDMVRQPIEEGRRHRKSAESRDHRRVQDIGRQQRAKNEIANDETVLLDFGGIELLDVGGIEPYR